MSNEPTIPEVGADVDGAVELIDPRAHRSIDPAARLMRLAGGGIWAEGPVYLPAETAVMYSDVRMNRAMRWSEGTGSVESRRPNDFTNGNTLDREGRVIHCEHGNRRIARRSSSRSSYFGPDLPRSFRPMSFRQSSESFRLNCSKSSNSGIGTMKFRRA